MDVDTDSDNSGIDYSSQSTTTSKGASPVVTVSFYALYMIYYPCRELYIIIICKKMIHTV